MRGPAWGKYGGVLLADLVPEGRSIAGETIAAIYGRPFSIGLCDTWSELYAGRSATEKRLDEGTLGLSPEQPSY